MRDNDLRRRRNGLMPQGLTAVSQPPAEEPEEHCYRCHDPARRPCGEHGAANCPGCATTASNDAIRAADELRCPLYDLPKTMCHHCKET